MRKFVLIMAAVLVLGMFAGCNGSPADATGAIDALTVYRVKDNAEIKLGENRQVLGDLLGPDEGAVMEFNDGFERASYNNSPGVGIDYYTQNNPIDSEAVAAAESTASGEAAPGTRTATPEDIAYSVIFENAEYKLKNGLTVGMTPDEAKKLFDESLIYLYEGYDTMFLSFDETGKQIKYDEKKAPFSLRIDVEEGKVVRVTVMDLRIG